MGNDDIEILDDFSEPAPNNNLNQSVAPSAPSNVAPAQAPVQPSYNNSVNEFEKMVNEVEPQVDPVPESVPTPQQEFVPNYSSDLKNELDNSFVNDTNNELVAPDQVSSNEQVSQAQEQDLTITAVYPNGLAIDQKDELENTQVIKPKAKGKTDIYLIIIVAVLAITLVVLLITFYL